ncbi:MAG: tRNA wybutosine-synthesizing 3 family protein [Nanoarchaeota archaeon]
MLQSNFLQRKKDILEKSDKSSKKSWDEKIIELCNLINNSENYYTTSSCAGRIVLMKDENKKGSGLFLKVWHDEIGFEEFDTLRAYPEKFFSRIFTEGKKELDNLMSKGMIKFKMEPPILHIACKNLECASELLENAKHIGFKRSGINTISKNILLELNSTEKLEFPIVKDGKILVNDEFLKIIVEKSNFLLEKGWEKIKKLEEFFEN